MWIPSRARKPKSEQALRCRPLLCALIRRVEPIVKNPVAIGIGIAFILVALLLAAGTTNQDASLRPQIAQVFATELHTTPSVTPTASATPTSTPTPLHITRPDPDAREVLALLFQYPYQGTFLETSRARVSTQPLYLEGYTRSLIVMGDRVTAGRGMQVASGAFGALLAWENGEYAVKSLQVLLGHGDMLVSYRASPSGTVIFRFRSLALNSEDAVRLQHTFILRPCSSPLVSTTPAAAERSLGLTQSLCYW